HRGRGGEPGREEGPAGERRLHRSPLLGPRPAEVIIRGVLPGPDGPDERPGPVRRIAGPDQRASLGRRINVPIVSGDTGASLLAGPDVGVGKRERLWDRALELRVGLGVLGPAGRDVVLAESGVRTLGLAVHP